MRSKRAIVSEEKQREACAKKRTYRRKHQARQGVAWTRKTFGRVVRPYRCPVCGFYHLTTRSTEQ